jgi:hypothetical protein
MSIHPALWSNWPLHSFDLFPLWLRRFIPSSSGRRAPPHFYIINISFAFTPYYRSKWSLESPLSHKTGPQPGMNILVLPFLCFHHRFCSSVESPFFFHGSRFECCLMRVDRGCWNCRWWQPDWIAIYPGRRPQRQRRWLWLPVHHGQSRSYLQRSG